MFNFSYTVWNKDHAVSVTCMQMVTHNDVKANEIQLWVVHNYQHFLKCTNYTLLVHNQYTLLKMLTIDPPSSVTEVAVGGG